MKDKDSVPPGIRECLNVQLCATTRVIRAGGAGGGVLKCITDQNTQRHGQLLKNSTVGTVLFLSECFGFSF